MKIERRHLVWALKRSGVQGAMMYMLVIGLGLYRSVEATTWVAGLAFAFAVHVILFGAALWQIRRLDPTPPPSSKDR